jgi:excisionase family DNA binding protein
VSTTHRGGRTDALLSIPEAADRLGTPIRFVRRLVAERRIGFTKVGRYVRFTYAHIDAFIAAGRVEPLDRAQLR